jgi:hypothetical protein
MLNLTELGVEVFRKRFNSLKQDSFWNNYNLIIWKQNPGGYSSVNGMFRNDSWGLTDTISVNDKGVWVLSKKYVKYFK